jgi:hypothetical protein
MTGTHGDLFREIGALVLAAHEGQSFDLKHTSEELARCYVNLGVPADTIARAIARSMAAVGVSMALLRPSQESGEEGGYRRQPPDLEEGGEQPEGAPDPAVVSRSAGALFPSGVRLAMLS